MSLEFNFSHSVDDVLDVLCDPDFLVARSLAIGEVSADAEIEEDDNGKLYIKMRREVVRDLPKFLAKIFNPQQILTMEEEWTPIGDNWMGKTEYTVEGQPVSIKTDMTLKPSGDGCTYSISYNVKADIPLIKGKVEKFIKTNCEEGAQKEMDFLTERLAG